MSSSFVSSSNSNSSISVSLWRSSSILSCRANWRSLSVPITCKHQVTIHRKRSLSQCACRTVPNILNAWFLCDFEVQILHYCTYCRIYFSKLFYFYSVHLNTNICTFYLHHGLTSSIIFVYVIAHRLPSITRHSANHAWQMQQDETRRKQTERETKASWCLVSRPCIIYGHSDESHRHGWEKCPSGGDFLLLLKYLEYFSPKNIWTSAASACKHQT